MFMHQMFIIMKKTNQLNSYNKVPRKGISWGAILAGTAATLSVMLILNLLGMAIGLWSIEPTEDSNPLSGLGTGSIIWWVLSNLIALFAGGFVAARVGVSFANPTAMIHGVMTWALYTLVSVWLLTSVVGSIVSGVGNIVGNVLSTTGEVLTDEVGGVIKDQFEGLELSLGDAKEEFYALLEDTGKKELEPERLEAKAEETLKDAKRGATDQARDADRGATQSAKRRSKRDSNVEGVFRKARNRFNQTFEAMDKEALVNILVERSDLSQREAEQTVDNLIAEFELAREEFEAFVEETKEAAREKAEDIAGAAGNAAFYLSISLLLGLVVAALGAFAGVKNLRDDYTKSYALAKDRDGGYAHREYR